MFGATVCWKCVVEAFDIDRHPRAKRCYAWSYQDGRQIRLATILEIPPVDSPQSTVRGAIMHRAPDFLRGRRKVVRTVAYTINR